MQYDTIIGLEIHVQTKTKSKMFCLCSTNYFQIEPNTHVCPVCLGLPGTLPIPNKRAIELCILMGLATDCKINKNIQFDRKHYFYPDLPKGYQISQYKDPICFDGKIILPSGQKIEIERIHQEEDVAKSLHFDNYTLIDYNKSGIPLIEIVTKPCIRNAKDAKDFATQIRQICRYLNISDADMEKGQMRCEPNISIQEKGKWKYINGKILPIGNYKLNKKVEIKNIGSITAVEKSIEYEIKRLIEEISNNREIKQQTRGWNADKGITEFQRDKETADDYRYMPEPDIPIIEISDKDIERISKELIELPYEKILRYTQKYSISTYAAEVISSTKENSFYFENLLLELKQFLDEKIAAKEAANWLMGTVYAIGKDIKIKDLSLVIKKFKEGIITKGVAEELLKDCLENQKDIAKELKKFENSSKENAEKLKNIIEEVIQNNPKAVADYKGGKTTTIGFLIGQVMQATKGSANPNETKDILEKLLK